MTPEQSAPLAPRWLPWVGALLGAAALVWVLRGFDLNRFRAVIANANLWFLLLVPLTIIVEQIVRGWKWRQLLWPLRSIRSLYLFGAIMAGYLLAIVVPFGFGTVARPGSSRAAKTLDSPPCLPRWLSIVSPMELSSPVLFPLPCSLQLFPIPAGSKRDLSGVALEASLCSSYCWLLWRYIGGKRRTPRRGCGDLSVICPRDWRCR
jgi:hypothetical protein